MTGSATIGPLDQALVDYCSSLEAPVKAAFQGVFEDSNVFPVTGMFGSVDLDLNRDNLHIAWRFTQEGGIQEIMRERKDDLRTREMIALVDLLQDRMPELAWPMRVHVWFDPNNLDARCMALGFAGEVINHWEMPGGYEGHLDIFSAGEGSRGHLLGLDRLAEAADFIASAMENAFLHGLIGEQEAFASVMLWSVENERAHGDSRQGRFHARSRFEAFLKWAVFTHGFEGTRKAMASMDLQALGNLNDLTFSASPISSSDLFGRAVSLYDVGEALAAAQSQPGSRPIR